MTPRPAAESASLRTALHGAVATIAGIVLSGPLAVVLVEVLRPQPAWRDAATFAAHYHPLQLVPYLGGFVLVGGLILLMAGLRQLAGAAAARADAALVLTAAFASLIFLNYVVQTTFVPELAARRGAGDDALVAALSMANPRSLAWAIEMWAWGFLGAATWSIAPAFRGGRLEDAARWTFVANGVVSLAGAGWTLIRPGWPVSEAGLIAYAAWNALLLAMAVLAVVALQRRAHGG